MTWKAGAARDASMSASPPVIPVLLCGGSGTRLWPLSRQANPKQFLALLDSPASLFQQTLARATDLCQQAPIIICSAEHRFRVAEQLRAADLPRTVEARIVLEPAARNTAPAIALAAHAALDAHPRGARLLVLPSDHVLKDQQALRTALDHASALPTSLPVTFGIVPTRPETGFGYLHAAQPIAGHEACRQVLRFIEKPPLEQARAYLDAGDHFWNSGMFLLDAHFYLQALEQLAPAVASAGRRAWQRRQPDPDFVRVDAEAMATCPAISIDYAVMEQLDSLAMVPLDGGWDDLGSFPALWAQRERDASGNARQGRTLCMETRNSLVLGDHKLIATLGLDGVVVVDTPDALLVASMNSAQDIRKLVDAVRNEDDSLL